MIPPQPIYDQFTVLERKIPELRGPSDEAKRRFLTMSAFLVIPSWMRMILLVSLLTCSAILFCLLLLGGGIIKMKYYKLDVYIPWIHTDPWMEIIRWTIVGVVICNGWIITNHSSAFIPQLVAYFAKRGRKVLPISVISSLETLCTLWRYLCYTATCLILWLLSLYIFTYPPRLVAASHKTGSYVWSELPIQYYVERLFLIMFISSIFLLIEKFFLHQIAKEFNQPLYRDRIQKALYSLWIVAVLRKAASVLNYSHISHHRAHFENLWRPKDFPYYSQDLLSIFVLEQFVKLGKKSGERKQTMARRLFRFLAKPDASTLLFDDIRPYFTRGEAEKAFAVLDTVGAGDVSEAEFVKVIDNIYQERTDLITVLLTNSDVVDRLDKFMLTFVGILIFFSLFPIIGFSPSEALVPLGVSITPTIVAGTLIFGETVKSIFASIIFLFATHPYDVGDRVYMDQGNYFVREIGLLSTMFERWDGFIVYIPNNILATKAICNVRRTGLQAQRIEIALPAILTVSQLTELENKLTNFVKLEARDFAAVRSCCYEMRNMNQLIMILSLKHRINFFDGYARVLRNNKFMTYLSRTINQMGIHYYTTIRCVELVLPETPAS